MGGNVCKELGIKPTKTIGTKEVEALWNGYAKGGKSLTKEEALKFLKQFAAAIGVEYSKQLGETWFEKAKGQYSATLNYDDFLRLFTLAVKEAEQESNKVNLTATLAGKLNFSLDMPDEEEEEPKQPKTDKTKALVTYEYKCKNCSINPITDVLYKCRDCPDYFLCSKCEDRDTHNATHVFIKVKTLQMLPNLPGGKPKAVPKGVIVPTYDCKCNNCSINPITDVLYKCRDCPDYFLCSKCEDRDTHNATHVFIKVKTLQMLPK
eukprot:TRINITY_DN182_c0_g1_i4.p1 TRINITY_DN182_c0_g1~~TRINITY_DN182_c0_g1_i4.p1  ORF type:complete len:264 (+),score=30.32 TRINITY_DN182_c0_g1_i4:92-883(+)